MFKLRFLTGPALVCMIVAGAAAPQNSADNVRRGKQATAYVELSGGSATAFCIDAAGYFATNDHVVADAGNSPIRLVLNPTEANQRVVEAVVVRRDVEADLAIVKANGPGPFVALDLGETDSLIETQTLTAFGYPFGRELAGRGAEYPAISVSVGRITALRKLKGALSEIQLDASLNPGNSGGPTLNEKGKVVGIVKSGVPGASLNFAVPVEKLKALMSKPSVTFSPTSVPFDKRAEPQQLVAELDTLNSSPNGFTVELTLRGNGGERTLSLTPSDGGRRHTTSAVLVEPSAAARVRATVSYASGSVAGEVPDQEVRVAGTTMKLSAIARADRESATPRVILASGETVIGSIEGAAAIPLDMGGQRVTIDIGAARRVEFSAAAPPERQVGYKVTVKKNGASVAELTGDIALTTPSLTAAPGLSVPPVSAPTASSAANRNAPPPPGPIAPPQLSADRNSVKLPAAADNAMLAGGGRFILLELRKLRQIAIFDVNLARVTHFLSMPSENFKAAAGMDDFVVVLPEMNQIQRWSLRTMERELAVNLGTTDMIEGVVMGYASAGPIMMVSRRDSLGAAISVAFYSLDSLRSTEIRFRDGATLRESSWMGSGAIGVTASADGKTFAAWGGGSGSGGIRLYSVDGNNATARQNDRLSGPLALSQDGSILFSASGVFTADFKALSPGQFEGAQSIPTVSAAYFLSRKRPDSFPVRGQTQADDTLSVYSMGDRRLLVKLPKLDELTPRSSSGPRGAFLSSAPTTLDKRVFLIPQAELLITIAEPGDELIVRKLNLLAEIDKTGVDYLFAASMAPQTARKGQLYRYAIDVKSKAGGVQYKLESGPAGMRIDTAGVLTWSVPPAVDSLNSVIVSIRDRSGQEIYHTFTITAR